MPDHIEIEDIVNEQLDAQLRETEENKNEGKLEGSVQE